METKQRETHMDRFLSVMKVGHEGGKKTTGNKVEVLIYKGEVSDLV